MYVGEYIYVCVFPFTLLCLFVCVRIGRYFWTQILSHPKVLVYCCFISGKYMA